MSEHDEAQSHLPDAAAAATREFDLGEYDLESAAERGAELEIRNPITGAGTGVFLIVVGADSQTYRDAYRKILDAAGRDQRRDLDASVYDMRAAQANAAIIRGWRSPGGPYLLYGGQRLTFSHENAVTVLLARRFVREQVEAFAGNRANFFQESGTSSARQ